MSLEEGLYLQPLSESLAPTDAERAAQPGLPMPRPGDLVVLNHGEVHWLQHLDDLRPITEDNTALWSTGIYEGAGHEWARSDELSTGPLDPDFPGLEEGVPEAIRAAWRLLLDHAETTRGESES